MNDPREGKHLLRAGLMYNCVHQPNQMNFQLPCNCQSYWAVRENVAREEWGQEHDFAACAKAGGMCRGEGDVMEVISVDREIKRVAMDFDWPLDKVWDGYRNPHYRECPDCKAGYSASFDNVARYVNSPAWDRAARTDSDTRKAIRKLGELAGLPDEWSTCSRCKGDGVHPDYRERFEAWEAVEPPAGDGYQMWENVSEGSPVSPVFATPEELARWLKHRAA